MQFHLIFPPWNWNISLNIWIDTLLSRYRLILKRKLVWKPNINIKLTLYRVSILRSGGKVCHFSLSIDEQVAKGWLQAKSILNNNDGITTFTINSSWWSPRLENKNKISLKGNKSVYPNWAWVTQDLRAPFNSNKRNNHNV